MTRDTGTGGKNSSVLNLHNSLKSKNENVLVSQNRQKDMYAMFNIILRDEYSEKMLGDYQRSSLMCSCLVFKHIYIYICVSKVSKC